MSRPRFRVRTLLIAIAVLAPFFALLAVIRDVNIAMSDFYGPRGKLAMEGIIGAEAAAGARLLAESRYAEAETRFRSVLDMTHEYEATMARHGWGGIHRSIASGLRKALIAQHGGAEAARRLGEYAADAEKAGDRRSAKQLRSMANDLRGRARTSSSSGRP